MNSIVYAGFGAGLADPNLSRALEWQKTVFPRSATRHFRLCLESEVSELQALHGDDNIEPVPYGATHDDLAPFLERRLAQLLA